jgi:hypothetical protein
LRREQKQVKKQEKEDLKIKKAAEEKKKERKAAAQKKRNKEAKKIKDASKQEEQAKAPTPAPEPTPPPPPSPPPPCKCAVCGELAEDELKTEAALKTEEGGAEEVKEGEAEALISIALVCTQCSVRVHNDCYGIPVGVLREGWLCTKCTVLKEEPTADVQCKVCPRMEGALKRLKDGAGWVHVACALWIPELSFTDNGLLEPIKGFPDIPAARFELECEECQTKRGVCVQCHSEACRASFHVSCAFHAGHKQEFMPVADEENDMQESAVAYCREHSGLPPLPAAEEIEAERVKAEEKVKQEKVEAAEKEKVKQEKKRKHEASGDEEAPPKKRGRKLGSKNKPKVAEEATSKKSPAKKGKKAIAMTDEATSSDASSDTGSEVESEIESMDDDEEEEQRKKEGERKRRKEDKKQSVKKVKKNKVVQQEESEEEEESDEEVDASVYEQLLGRMQAEEHTYARAVLCEDTLAKGKVELLDHLKERFVQVCASFLFCERNVVINVLPIILYENSAENPCTHCNKVGFPMIAHEFLPNRVVVSPCTKSGWVGCEKARTATVWRHHTCR